MQKKIQSALISVFNKDGLQPIVEQLHQLGVVIYSTGGTQQYIEMLGIACIGVETLTGYPSILGGRVKTLHPAVFGGILGRRAEEKDKSEMREFQIPEIDLVIVDLYPFEETVATTSNHQQIIEKIDIGGPSMIRAAAKNFTDVMVVASKKEYAGLLQLLQSQNGETSVEQRKAFATLAFKVVAQYDIAIANWMEQTPQNNLLIEAINGQSAVLRYGENPHQLGVFYGQTHAIFEQLHGKELSYNNLVDTDAALQLIREFNQYETPVFAIIKHTNVCGIAAADTVLGAWKQALKGDPESAFGGVLVCNRPIDEPTAEAIQEIFFEVLAAPLFEPAALQILQSKKNRILLQYVPGFSLPTHQFKSVLNGLLVQDNDQGNYSEWKEAGGRATTPEEKKDLHFANIIAKHLKSNAIALVKHQTLIGKGCGQTSRIDALRQAIEKARQFNADLNGAVMASDAFFPFSDCVEMAHKAGISAFIQPGGSIRDQESVDYCSQHQLAMVLTGMRHFKH